MGATGLLVRDLVRVSLKVPCCHPRPLRAALETELVYGHAGQYRRLGGWIGSRLFGPPPAKGNLVYGQTGNAIGLRSFVNSFSVSIDPVNIQYCGVQSTCRVSKWSGCQAIRQKRASLFFLAIVPEGRTAANGDWCRCFGVCSGCAAHRPGYRRRLMGFLVKR